MNTALALGQFGLEAKAAVPALVKALEDEDPRVRREAAAALGRIGPEAKVAAPALVKLREDEDPRVRGNAAVALREIGSEFEATISALVEAPVDNDPGVRERGKSKAHPDGVVDGQVVLLRRGVAIAALIFTKQEGNPERAEFDYRYRNDGGVMLDPSASAVTSGHGVTTGLLSPSVIIGSIEMEWSHGGSGSGFIYYDYYSHETHRRNSLEICVTELRSLDEPIDVSQFVFSQKPPQK